MDRTKNIFTAIGNENDHEFRRLVKAIKTLSTNKQRVVIQNAISLIGIIKDMPHK
jgi:predicted nucleic acid-binding protein